MVNRVQTLRSSTAGARPAVGSRQPGELYTNWPDNAFGVINASQAPVDLLPIRFFSSLAAYAAGDMVRQAGQLYIANVAITAGAFNATQWNKIAVAGDYLPLAGGTLTGNLTLGPATGTAQLTLAKHASGDGNFIWGNTASASSPNRWLIELGDQTAESGSDAGSNCVFYAFGDTGTQRSALNLNRANLSATFSGLITVSVASGNNILTLNNAAASGAVAMGLLTATRSANRWAMYLGDGSTESGSDAGSNLALYNFKDNASFTLCLSASRATGVFNFAVTPTINNNPIGSVKLAGGTVSNVANLALSLPTGYRSYRLILHRCEPAVAATLCAIMSTNNGSSYFQAGGSYAWTQKYTTLSGEGTASSAGTGGTSVIQITSGSQAAAANNPGFTVMDIDPGKTATASLPVINWKTTYGVLVMTTGGGYLGSGTTLTNILFYYSTGNIYGADYELYGFV